jgi:hypothetical protein
MYQNYNSNKRHAIDLCVILDDNVVHCFCVLIEWLQLRSYHNEKNKKLRKQYSDVAYT